MRQDFPSRSWAEIDLDILASNMKAIREMTNPQAKVMAVVKADAYGHGAIEVSKVLLENGADKLAVSMLDEAIELRNHAITAPILILGHTDPRRISELIHHDIEQTVYSLDYAKAVSAAAVEEGKTARIHIKYDTGMNRLGFLEGESSIESILSISKLPGIAVEGMFSHFSMADTNDDEYTMRQFNRFQAMGEALEAKGLHVPTKHICNSAGIIRFPQMHLDMVRAGLIVYGMMPEGCPVPYKDFNIRPAMTLKSSVVHVKTLAAGESVSYGRNFKTEKESVIATIAIGYADGYARRLSNCAKMLMGGKRVPVVGNICMDMCMVDATELQTKPKVSDEVVLFGHQSGPNGTDEISVDEISAALGTINYEITCLIGKRIPRVYLRNGEIVHMHSCIW
ncbi:MAG TPA: alanine racemase [Bacillota bacterium]|nr:alanine racemase [Bacillota bacterium]